ncbi:hypothetical protein AB1Y20_002250 [Prymnesium parvum]|uniref:PPM-type phosphatase domain-containing protein n=1 Tax=Prymnesium parvum TaxID=97485 RepID=A0AB34J802_PRYPA
MKRQRVPPLAVGVASSKGRKQAQEDVPLVAHCIGDDEERSFYAVLDGHGGRHCAAWAAERLPQLLASHLAHAASSPEVKDGIRQAFVQCDDELLDECRRAAWSDGCCVIGLLVDRKCTPPRVYCANLGDSRAYACVVPPVDGDTSARPAAPPSTAHEPRDEAHAVATAAAHEPRDEAPAVASTTAQKPRDEAHAVGAVPPAPRAVPLSKDHSPSDAKERKRIEAAGGNVVEGRVCGSLEVSRSLGDVRLKRHGLLASPDVTSFAVGAEQRFVLLACDGLWKAFSGKEAVEFVHERLPRMDARRRELNRTLGDAVALSAMTREAVDTLQKEREAMSEDAILRKLVHEAVHNRSAKDNVTCILVRL